jgi:hypothetical protein
MRALDGTGLARQLTGSRSGRARRGALAAALLGITLLYCLFALAAAASAAPPESPAQALLAKLALQQAELTAAQGAALDVFGSSVAVSGDTALVGAPHHTVPGKPNAGAAYVFVRSGGYWTLQAELNPIDAVASDEFGTSVALSGDTALVGVPLQSIAGTYRVGAAYVFTRSGGAWTQQARLLAADGGSDYRFGSSVAVSGETALIGAQGRMGNTGAAYVFTRSGGYWTQAQTLTAPDGAAYDELGRSVALSGKTALVGAPLHDAAGKVNAGAAYVFTRSGGFWTGEGRLTAFDAAASDQFGTSVAVSRETALVGAPHHGIPGTYNPGVACVFTRSGGSWPQQAELIAFDASAGEGFGSSVAVSGGAALVGAPSQSIAGKASAGVAYVFTRSGGSWTQQGEPIAEDAAAGDQFGTAVALSGATALVGAPGHDSAGGPNAGAAYVFLTVPTVTKLTPVFGKRGSIVTIGGSGFGAARGAGSVAFGSKTGTIYASWSDTKIKCKVPAKARYGAVQVTVTTAGGMSNATGFTVKR